MTVGLVWVDWPPGTPVENCDWVCEVEELDDPDDPLPIVALFTIPEKPFWILELLDPLPLPVPTLFEVLDTLPLTVFEVLELDPVLVPTVFEVVEPDWVEGVLAWVLVRVDVEEDVPMRLVPEELVWVE